MKKVLRKILLLLLLGGCLFIALSFFSNRKSMDEDQPYSSVSAKLDGTKALYLLVNQMGFQTERFKRPARLLPDKATMLVVKPLLGKINEKVEKKYLRQWIEAGNTILFIDNEADHYSKDLGFSDEGFATDGESVFGENVAKGKVFIFNTPKDLTNGEIHNVNAASKVIDILERIGNRKVIFNEYYHGLSEGDITLWDLFTRTQKFMVVQVILSLLLFLYVLSRRFGKPIPVFKMIKRKENENLFAFANLYSKARANSLVLEAHLQRLMKEILKYLGFTSHPDDQELLLVASKDTFLFESNFKEVYEESKSYIEKDSKDKKRFLTLLEKIEEIRKGIQ